MIDYTYKDLFMDDSVSKQLIIEYDSTVITNEDLFDQTMTLEESLCSEQELRFGCCEASVLKFKVANIVAPMKGKWLSVKMVLNNHTDEPFVIGRYKVEEDKLTSDRKWREIVAYDVMQDIINADGSEMAAWYNTILPEDNKNTWVTMRSFRTSFLQHFGIVQETIELVNDYMKVERTIAPEQISGKDIITAICEINGCFGHIGRDGKFHWIYLPQEIQGLYPANDLYPADDLFPRNPKGEKVGANGTYITVDWQDFITKSINKIQIRQEENDIGKIYPDTPINDSDNSYIIENNFLVYGKSSNELLPIAQNLLSKIAGIEYRPMTNSDIKGNLCFEVGDPIRIGTKYELVETYIFERTLKGIQSLRDSFKSNGVEKYSEQVNGVHASIIQLKGKTNILTRTIEETKSEIKDVEKGLGTKITQNAEAIITEADRAKKSEEAIAGTIISTAESLFSEIEQTAENITTSVGKKIEETKEYADGKVESAATVLDSKIDQTAEHITSTVSETYETKTDAGTTREEFSSKIEQTSKKIEDEVTARTNEGKEIKASLALKIDNDDDGAIVSLINGTADKIHFGANNMFTVDSPNFKVGENGTVTVSGDIIGSSIHGGTINGAQIYSGGTGSTSYTNIENGEMRTNSLHMAERDDESGYGVANIYHGPSSGHLSDITFKGNTIQVSPKLAIADNSYDVMFSDSRPYASLEVAHRIYTENAICPRSDTGTSCGAASFRWSNVYCQHSAINTSDRNEKYDIKDLAEIYEKLFFKLRAKSFKFKNGDRTHIGIIAQDLESAMEELGLSDMDIAALCKDVKKKIKKTKDEKVIEVDDLDVDGNRQYRYGVRYGEFVMLEIHMLQKAYQKINEQQEQINRQQEEINLLKESVSVLLKERSRANGESV